MHECEYCTPLPSRWAAQRAKPLATNVARGSREPASARSTVTGEQTIEQESPTDDVQDEEDLEGYGFGV